MSKPMGDKAVHNTQTEPVGAIPYDTLRDAFPKDSPVLNALIQISNLANASQSDDSFYRKLHQQVETILEAENFFIALTNRKVSWFKFTYYVNNNDELEPATLNALPLEKLQKSFSAYTARAGRPLLMTRKQQEELLDAGVVERIGDPAESWLGVPIELESELLGVLVLQINKKGHAYSLQDVSLATFVAQNIAVAIHNRRYSQRLAAKVRESTLELQQKNKELNQKILELTKSELVQKVLLELGQSALESALSIEAYCQAIHEQIAQLIYAENFFVVLSDTRKQSFSFVYFVDSVDPVGLSELRKIPLRRIRRSLTGQVIERGHSILLNQQGIEKLVAEDRITMGGVMTKIWLGTPLISNGEVIGAMVVQSYRDESDLSPSDQALMEFVASHVAFYIERKRYRDELELLVEKRTNALQKSNRALARQIEETTRAEKLQNVLYQLSEVASSARSDKEIYSEIHKIISSIIYAENFFIALKDADETQFRLVYYVDERDQSTYDSGELDRIDYSKKSLTRIVYDTRQSVLYTGEELTQLFAMGRLDSIGPQAASWLGVPLRNKDEVIGVIAVQSYKPDFQYQDWHRSLLEYVSQQVIATIQRGHAKILMEQEVKERTKALEEEIAQRTFATKTQEVLYQISELSSAEMPLFEFYRRVHETISQLIYAENFYIALYHKEDSCIHFEYFVDSMDQDTLQSIPVIPEEEIDQRLTGYVYRHGEPLLLNNAEIKKLSKQLGLDLQGPDCVCWLAIPLIIESEVIGVMTLQSYIESQIYDEQDLMLMVYVSQHIATAIQRFSNKQRLVEQVESATAALRKSNEQLREEIRQRQESEKLQRALFRISETPTHCATLKELYPRLHKIISELMYAESFYIALVDKENQRFIFDYVVDQVDKDVPKSLPMGKGLTSYVYERKTITHLKPRDIARLEKQGKVEHFGTYSVDWIGVPLKIEDEIHGIMVIQSYDEESTYTEQDINVLEFVSQHIANALQRQLNTIAIQQANQQLKEKTIKAEAASEAKSQFLATMSHEIRTPMNGVMGMLSLLKETSLDEKQADYVQKIDLSANSLLSLINDILDFSKIEQGKMDIERIEFSLYELIDSLIDLFATRIKQKQLTFIVDISGQVEDRRQGDPLRISQILINLIGNALKFTEQGHIVLSISQAQQSQLTFRVIDSGIGLTAEQADKIFDSFTQADGSTTRRFGGSGLGLSICKRLALLMGGNIQLESQPGQGSCFELNLQLPVISSTDEMQKRMQSADKTPVLVVIAEDEQAIQDNSFPPTPIATFCRFAQCLSVPLQVIGCKGLSNSPELLPHHSRVVIEEASLSGTLLDIFDQLHRAGRMDQLLCISSEDSATAFSEALPDWVCKVESPIKLRICESFIRGKTMNFCCPLDKAPAPKAVPSFAQQSVLLVEDNPINQQVAQELLHRLGLNVVVANHGRQALTLCQSQSFALILMDVQMPVMDGFEATQRIRTLADYKQTPVIAMTANVMKGDREKCLASGMNDYLSKPVDRQFLVAVLQKWLPQAQIPKQKTTDKPVPVASREDPNKDILDQLYQKFEDRELVFDLIRLFVSTHDKDPERLHQMVIDQDYEAIERLSHKLKGSSSELGCEALFDAAQKLNHFHKAHKNELNLELVDRFCQELQKTLAIFRRLVADSANP